MSKRILKRIVIIFMFLAVSAVGAAAQTTTFTYQGKLNDNGLAANANFDMQFKLFSLGAGGNQIGATLSVPNVAVASGIFTVRLDFGANFDGTDRFLEIALKPAGSPNPYTVLAPRQPVTSTPYAIQSMNATNAQTSGDSLRLGGTLAADYVQTSDARMTDARTPLAGSPDYVQNTQTPQANANFNVSGDGTVGGTLSGNTVNAATEFRINGSRALSFVGTFNTFVGNNIGAANTTGIQNTFVGALTGAANTTGNYNTFVGTGAGGANVSGIRNSFFGNGAGQLTTASFNSFFGNAAGFSNTAGINNSFFGHQSGLNNLTGNDNAFFGYNSGNQNSSGSSNSFFGSFAGNFNRGSQNTFVGWDAGNFHLTGDGNTALGYNTRVGDGITNSTVIGANSTVSTSDTMVLGNNAVTVQIPGNLNVAGTLTANLPSGSANYIQNSNAQQAAANFNISGNGTVGGTLSANAVNSATQFNINGSRALSFAGTLNTFVGNNIGAANTTGIQNTFVGALTGAVNTTGNYNTFVGTGAGSANVSGERNSFFGNGAGQSTTANFNSFFGNAAGFTNVTGTSNSFFGNQAGLANNSGSDNSFYGNLTGATNNLGSKNAAFGASAGINNTSGSNNIFLGYHAGVSNTVENNNMFLGYDSNGAAGITNATAIGANAVVTQSNTMVLGTNVVTVQVPGNLTVTGTLNANLPSGSTNYIQNSSLQQAAANFNISGNGAVGGSLTADNIGIGTTTPNAKLDIFGGSVALNGNMLRLQNAGDNFQGLLYSNVVDGPEFRGFGGFRWTFNAGASEAMRLSAGGNLGIGTTNPTSRLTVEGDASVSGTLSGNAVNSATQFNIGGVRVFKAVGASYTTIAGADSGSALTSGIQNTFVGSLTGTNLTTGNYNTFVGTGAGNANVAGDRNSYFGNGAGQFNTSGSNSFFGYAAGFQNVGGSGNSFFGDQAGMNGASGSGNSFFGANAGMTNTANGNSFFGYNSGSNNAAGFSNSFFGYEAGMNNTGGNHNTFFGYNAGGNNTTGKNNTFVGWFSGLANTTEDNNTLLGNNSNTTAGIFHATALGADAVVTASNQIVLGTNLDSVRIPGLLGGGSNHLCFSADNVIQGCSSSLRYKTNFAPYTRSLDVIDQLRPISFDWKSDGTRDLGFGAEDVAKIDPLLVTYNARGEVEGVKYERLSTVFVNAFKEQQAQIASQQELIKKQEAQIERQQTEFALMQQRLDALTGLVCQTNPAAKACAPATTTRAVKKQKRRTRR